MLLDVWHAISWFVTRPGVTAIVGILTAVATTGSVIAALLISRRAERHQITRDQIEAEARLERRAERQAVLIRVEVVGRPDSGPISTLSADVSNLSELPIYNVVAAVQVGDPKPNGTQYQGHFDGGNGRTIYGAGHHQFQITIDPPANATDSIYAEAVFGDAYGDGWNVTSFGHLTQEGEKIISRQIHRA